MSDHSENTPDSLSETEQNRREVFFQGLHDLENVVDLTKTPCDDREDERTATMDGDKEQSGQKPRKYEEYRKREDLPYPDLPASAEINRKRKEMKTRLPQDVIDRITAFADAVNKPRQKCVEEAIVEYLQRSDLKLKL